MARNSALNVLGHVAPLAVAFLSLPLLVRGFGQERFGVLTLAWAAIGYFGLFEFGLGRALTQAVARRIGSARMDELPAVSQTALRILLLLGVVGGLALAGSASAITQVLKVPEHLKNETFVSFVLLGISLPFVLGTVGLRALMEAHNHFGVATALRIPLAVVSFAAPLLVLPFSASLIPAIATLVAGRAIAFAAHLYVCHRRYEYLRIPSRRSPGLTRELLHFGGWTTVSNIASPLMVYADRFVIGSALGLAAVTAYATPLEMVVKLLLIPVALSGVFLPVFAATYETEPRRMSDLYERALRANMLVTFPIVLVIVAMAETGLRLWMGDALPHESVRVLQWLALGLFVTAVAQAPFTALQSAARPDVIAKLHLLEIPLYALMLTAFLRWRGLEGAAMAWTARTVIDAIALLWMSHRRLGVALLPRHGGALAPVLMVAAIASAFFVKGAGMKALFLTAVLPLFAIVAWRYLLTDAERIQVRAWLLRQPALPVKALLVMLLALGTTACGPCSTTIACETSPKLSITGQILDENSGKGVRSSVELQREGGIELNPSTLSVRTGTNGAFDMTVDGATSGQAIVRLVVTPDGARPFIVKSLTVSTVNIRGDALVLPPWARPTLPYAFRIARASNDTPIDSAIVRFTRASGPELRLHGAPAAVVADTTEEAGYAFVFDNVTLDSTGVVSGTLSVQVRGMASPYLQTISITAIPQFRLLHAQASIAVPGL